MPADKDGALREGLRDHLAFCSGGGFCSLDDCLCDCHIVQPAPALDVEVLWDVLVGMGVLDNGTWVSFTRPDAEHIAEAYETVLAASQPVTEEPGWRSHFDPVTLEHRDIPCSHR